MDSPSSKENNLRFAVAMLKELRRRTHADGEELLTYLIDMAYMEASDSLARKTQIANNT
jgi:hypothetical protein